MQLQNKQLLGISFCLLSSARWSGCELPNEMELSYRWRQRAEFALELLKPFESYASQWPAVGYMNG
jgi:hypothetical protein